MRFRLAALFVLSALFWPDARLSAQENGADKDKEKKIAEVQKEIADLRVRLADLEAKLAKLKASVSPDLLALVDLEQDTVAGDWKSRDKHLFSPGTPDAKMAFPVRPSGDYQLTVKFKRHEGNGGPILCLPVGDRHVNFTLDGFGGQFTALEAVDGASVDNPTNPSQIKGKHVITDRSHTLEATVLMKGDTATIRVDLDGKQLMNWTGKSNRLTLHPAWRLKDDRQPGLRSWQVFEFEAVQLRMITGEANPIRESIPSPQTTPTDPAPPTAPTEPAPESPTPKPGDPRPK